MPEPYENCVDELVLINGRWNDVVRPWLAKRRELLYSENLDVSSGASASRNLHHVLGILCTASAMPGDDQAYYRSEAIPATGFLYSIVRPIVSGLEIPTSRCCWIPHLDTHARPCHSATPEAPTATTRMSTEFTQHGQRREPARSALFQDLFSRSYWRLKVSGFRSSVVGTKKIA